MEKYPDNEIHKNKQFWKLANIFDVGLKFEPQFRASCMDLLRILNDGQVDYIKKWSKVEKKEVEKIEYTAWLNSGVIC